MEPTPDELAAAEAAIINHPTFGRYCPTSPYYGGTIYYSPSEWYILITLYLEGGEPALWRVF